MSDSTGMHLIGQAGLATIRRRVLDAVYVIDGEYRTPVGGRPAKPGGRVAKTCEALGDGPQPGRYLYARGNHMPHIHGTPCMSAGDFNEHVKWLARNSRLHVVV